MRRNQKTDIVLLNVSWEHVPQVIFFTPLHVSDHKGPVSSDQGLQINFSKWADLQIRIPQIMSSDCY